MSTPIRQALKMGWISQGIGSLGFVGRAVVVIESVLFPLVFLFFAAGVVVHFFKPLEEPILGAETPFGLMTAFFDLVRHPGELPGELQVYVALGTVVVRPLLLLFFNLMCATFIALRSGLRYKPTTLGEILIPFTGTFIMLLLPLSTQIGRLGEPIPYPPGWTLPMIAVGTTLGVAGGGFAVYALLYLKRNFSIFVEVREIVLSGPYRYVRHPMYLGEVAMVTGLVMTMLNPFSIALLLVLTLFQYLRAGMEQNRLATASPEYAEHMRQSGMFFPKR
jgi:protein-S-isoprenylcysteine O-methyltransferase Ste14